MKTQKSLLQGAPYKHLIRLSLPLVIGNCLQQLYNTIDAMVIGHFAGINHFAAIGLAGSIMNLFLFAIVGACSGVTIMFSQLYGSDNLDAFCKEHYLALTLGSSLAFLLGILGIIAAPWLLSITMTPVELLSPAKCYLQIVLLGLPVTYLFNLYCSMLRSIGNTNTALCILICSTVINLILDLLFIGKLGMGISGAAAATISAQLISAVIAIYYIKKKASSLLFQKKHRHIDSDLMNKTAKLSFVTAFQQCSLYLGKIIVQGSVNSLGVNAISAFTAAGRVEGFINSFGDSGSLATSILIAQNQGAKKDKRVRESFWHSMILLLLFGSICSILLHFLAPAAIAVVSKTTFFFISKFL